MKITSYSVHDFIADVAKKAIISQSVAAGTARIGIFWLILKDGKPSIFHSVTEILEFGMDYGDFIISPCNHYNIWQSLKPSKIVPSDKYDYDYLPRGRVAYNKIDSKYYVYHGPWISSASKSVVKNEFKLPSSTIWTPDTHYAFKRWGFTDPAINK